MVGPGEDGVLEIIDKRSRYCGMPVWKFKSQVLRAMGQEFSFRTKKEEQAVLLEDRKRRPVKYPAPPIYHRATGVLEYPDYHNETIKKLKHQDA